jgi:prevent-host-death family protein
MKKYTYSQARQKLSEVLDTALKEDVTITRRGGETFRVTRCAAPDSPFDVPAIKTRATTRDVLASVRESRRRGA